MRTAGSSDPTAIGLPRSLPLLSLEAELAMPPSANDESLSCSSLYSSVSMKISSTALSKNSSESGSNAFHLLHFVKGSGLGSGSVRTAGDVE